MNIVGRRSRWVFGRTAEHGGAGDPGPWTALGVSAGLRAACRHAFGEDALADRTILVQGVGSVGGPLARRLTEQGARLILTDALPGRAALLADEIGADTVAPELTYETPCDVFAPCAIGGVLNPRSIPRLRCRVVGGSANNVLESDSDAALLHERGILYAPDFVINAGGAIAHGALEVLRWSEDRARARVERIHDTLDEILAEAAERRESPLAEATRRAGRILEEAHAARHRSDSLQPA
jgi:leucine dehydrogenase